MTLYTNELLYMYKKKNQLCSYRYKTDIFNLILTSLNYKCCQKFND